MLYRLAADLLLLLHVCFVVFVVAGLALIFLGAARNWGWILNPWFRTAHLASIGIVVAQAWLGRICPLTTWEMALREKAGDVTYAGSFIAHWLQSLLYFEAPLWVFGLIYSVFAAVVVASWLFIRPRQF